MSQACLCGEPPLDTGFVCWYQHKLLSDPGKQDQSRQTSSAFRDVPIGKWLKRSRTSPLKIAKPADNPPKMPTWRTEMSFLHDLKFAVRSLSRARALWITVALTLALGNRRQRGDLQHRACCAAGPARQSRRKIMLLYVRQSALGIGEPTNAASPCLRFRTLASNLNASRSSALFSVVDFTVVGLVLAEDPRRRQSRRATTRGI